MHKLKQLLDDHEIYHSKFQQDHFITTRAGGTQYGQYKQSLRELYKRVRGIRESMYSIELQNVEIEEQKYIAQHNKNVFKSKKADIKSRQKTALLDEAYKSLSDEKREFTRFYQQASYLKEQIGELTDEKRDKLDKEMWVYKIKEMIALDFACDNRLRTNTYELINALPPDLKSNMIKQLKEPQKLVDWYENKKEPMLPKEFPALPLKDETLLLKEFESNV